MRTFTFALVAFAAVCSGQQACEKNPDYCKKVESPLEFNVYKCTKAGGCSKDGTNYLTMDSNWRWTQKMGTWSNCWDNDAWVASECSSESQQDSCATSCMLEGVEYSEYAVTTADGGDSVTMKFMGSTGNVGARLYVIENHDPNAAEVGEQWRYKPFDLRNKEMTFTIEQSTLTCGLNGPAYLVEMPLNGDYDGSGNTAGALYGTGYCDAQCPGDLKFVKGKANIPIMETEPPFNTESAFKNCCAEMDLWESNIISTALTPHPVAFASNGSTIEGQYICTDDRDECRKNSDTAGCDWATYRMEYYNNGNIGSDPTYYGAGSQYTIDSTKEMTVVTQFITDDGTDNGNLVEIRRIYEQDGKTIAHMSSTIDGVTADSLTDEMCSAMDKIFDKSSGHFEKMGGMKGMGDALSRGMTLVLSLWDDKEALMRWLDGVYPPTESTSTPGAVRGTCGAEEGPPSEAEANFKDAYVTYKNLKYGELGSTFNSGSMTTPTPATPTTPTPAATTPTPANSNTTPAPTTDPRVVTPAPSSCANTYCTQGSDCCGEHSICYELIAGMGGMCMTQGSCPSVAVFSCAQL